MSPRTPVHLRIPHSPLPAFSYLFGTMALNLALAVCPLPRVTCQPHRRVLFFFFWFCFTIAEEVSATLRDQLLLALGPSLHLVSPLLGIAQSISADPQTSNQTPRNSLVESLCFNVSSTKKRLRGPANISRSSPGFNWYRHQAKGWSTHSKTPENLSCLRRMSVQKGSMRWCKTSVYGLHT